jgi:hypothetical protein
MSLSHCFTKPSNTSSIGAPSYIVVATLTVVPGVAVWDHHQGARRRFVETLKHTVLDRPSEFPATGALIISWPG